MSAIFISYRREDTEGHAGRLFGVLVERFGKGSVFMDVAGIEPGRDFRKAIDSNVADCGALLAVIGKGWLSAKNEAGLRRIDDPHDFVRLETVSALKRDIPVIPVLVHGAVMPRADQLPPELQELAFRNGVELTHARWDSDVQLLTKALERYVNKSPEHDAHAAIASPTTPSTPADTAASARSPAMKYLGIAGIVAALAAGGTALYLRNANEAAKLAVAVSAPQPATVSISEPRAAASLGTDGRKVTRVTFKDNAGNTAGYFRQTTPGAWVETGPSGNDERYRFQETGRDDWSVYLIDQTRNMTIQLDLYKRWVLFQDGNNPRTPLYEITAAN